MAFAELIKRLDQPLYRIIFHTIFGRAFRYRRANKNDKNNTTIKKLKGKRELTYNKNFHI